MNHFSLEGRVVLITGGSGFLGEYFVKALTEAGADVALTYLNHSEPAEALASEVSEKFGCKVLALQMDVSDPASVAEGFAQAIEYFGKLDVLVNNAAIDPKFDAAADKNSKLFEHYPTDLLKKSLDVNLLGYVLPSQQAVKHMKKNKSGVIINISSIYGHVGPDQRIYPPGTQKPVDYAITKGGIVMLTKWLATSYGADGIRANTLTFGGVEKGHDAAFLEKYGSRNPLGRMMQPEEVGGPLVFLASPAASYMTGADVLIDGGWCAW